MQNVREDFFKPCSFRQSDPLCNSSACFSFPVQLDLEANHTCPMLVGRGGGGGGNGMGW